MPKIPVPTLKPFWATSDNEMVRLYHGDVISVLKRLPTKSVHCVVTSPPYWGLRDYGTAKWDGGDENCNHLRPPLGGVAKSGLSLKFNEDGYTTAKTQPNSAQYVGTCKKCGAKRIDQQIGSEESPDIFVAKMVEVFREIHRVLRDDGCLWLNLGDSYSGGGGYSPNSPSNLNGGSKESRQDDGSGSKPTAIPYRGLKAGNLVGIPWRVALALQADGWVLRQDIIWSKPSPMPESVRNRCTKSHEYVFLLVKQSGYFYDAEAIRESLGQSPEDYKRMLESKQRQNSTKAGTSQEAGAGRKTDGFNSFISDGKTDIYVPSGRNKRSVWSIASQGYEGAHFATFPPKLIEPCILAGTSEYGCCAKCGAPWKRVTEEKVLTRERPNDYVKRQPGTVTRLAGAYNPPGQTPSSVSRGVTSMNTCSNSVAGVEVKTVGWEPTCECYGKFVTRKGKRLGYGSYHAHEQDGVAYGLRQDGKGPASNPGEPSVELDATIIEYVSDLPLDDHPIVPCTVLDPFIGSGTSCVVSLTHGRRSIGIDLSEKYLRNNAVPRIEGALLGIPEMAHLTGRKRVAVDAGEEL